MRTRAPILFALAVSSLSLGPPAHAADIAGAWQVHGSVFFNAVDTLCHFKADGAAAAPRFQATCENDGKPGQFTPATVAGDKVAWSWDAGPAVLAFQATLTSDTTMKGEIQVRGFTGSFTATKQ